MVEDVLLRSFLTQRAAWLKTALADTRPDVEQITLWGRASYLPADYYGEDIGLVYNEAAYRKNYPNLSEAYGGDSEGLMDSFCEEGMYEGQMGTDWQMYYSEFMVYGYGLEWTRLTGRGFGLTVSDALEER